MPYTAPQHLTQHWEISKPAATGRRGMVASQSRDAALAGIAILDAGGNAIDAAVATAIALATAEPWNSGLGGIGFAVVHRAGQPRAEVVDFGPRAPAGLQADRFKLTGKTASDLFGWPEVEGDANVHGPLSFAVPSSTAGYAHMHGRWGKLPLSEIMAPAIALARRGLSQDWFTTLKIANSAAIIRNHAESARIYLPNGLPPVAPYQGRPGYLQQGRLADTLEHLSRAGLRDFYEGDIATSIAKDTAELGGVLDAEDLRRCEATIRDCMEVPFHGRTLQLAGGLTAAPTMARVLELLPGAWPEKPDAAWFAALAGAMRTAYAERLSGLGDAEPKAAESCTTHLTVVDAAGTMVAMTTTLLSSMGSRVVLPGSGVLMNNGIMWFDPRPGQPNSVGPGKRPLTNMLPIILRDGGDAGGEPVLAGGASGGRRILAAVTQVLAFAAGFGMSPAEAAHHPRIDVSDPDTVHADQRLDDAVMAALRAQGPVEDVEHGVLPVNFACPNLIVLKGGIRTGITDVMSPWSAAVAQA
jgi:gamma-glutamyltranspeptidase/glutathione hydrolase